MAAKTKTFVVEGKVDNMGGVGSPVQGVDRVYAVTINPVDREKDPTIAAQTSINFQVHDRNAFPVDAKVKITMEVTPAED